MRISDKCASCLYDKQQHKNNDPVYLARVKDLLDNRKDSDTSPYMVYLFNQIHQEMFGSAPDYKDIKRRYNDFVLNMEDKIRDKIAASDDPVNEALTYAMVGNYIDFGAMNNVDDSKFIALMDKTHIREEDLDAYDAFIRECEDAKSFLLICDNCGEIVLDKLLIEQLKIHYPDMKITALVRGGEVLNDATREDAEYCGLDKAADIIDNGCPVGGTIIPLMPEESLRILQESDVILSKGQGNYESLSDRGIGAYYMFLCKCDLFTSRFDVPPLTGIFVYE